MEAARATISARVERTADGGPVRMVRWRDAPRIQRR
jgi:hypothetical protein